MAVWLSMMCPSRCMALTSEGLALAQAPMGNMVALTLFRSSVARIDLTCVAEP